MGVQKDNQANEILYQISGERFCIKREFGIVKDYTNYMKSLCEKITALAKDEISFNENINEIKHDLYDLGTLCFCFVYLITRIKNSFDDYKNDDISCVEKLDRFFGFPGSHDFNLCLARYFSYDLFCSFYLLWMQDVLVLIDSNGEVWPRFLHVINKDKNGININLHILLTKWDVGYRAYFGDQTNIEAKKKHYKSFAFRDILSDFPSYFVFQKELPSMEKYTELYGGLPNFDKKYQLSLFIKENYDIFSKFENISVQDLCRE